MGEVRLLEVMFKLGIEGQERVGGRVWRLTPVIPALLKAKVGVSLEARS